MSESEELHILGLFFSSCSGFPGLVHVGDELREVNGNRIAHRRPDEISQILVNGGVWVGGGALPVEILYDRSLMMCLISASPKAPSH